MPEYVRIAEFEGDQAALDTLVNDIKSHDGPPDGVPATRINVAAQRDSGKIMVVVHFASKDDLDTGNKVLDEMTPPAGATLRRTSVSRGRSSSNATPRNPGRT